jgi:hypothetical protein
LKAIETPGCNPARDWLSFRLIGVEQSRAGAAKHDCCELPHQIVCVLDAGIHPVSTGRRHLVCSIADEKNATAPVGLRDPGRADEGRSRNDFDRQFGRTDRGANQSSKRLSGCSRADA